MQRSFIHDLYSSFAVWFDHTLLSKGEAFSNVVSGQLYKMSSHNVPNMNVWGSPYKQWVYDSSISGATIPSGVKIGTGTLNRGTSGLVLDFENGRAMATGLTSVTGAVCSYSVKDFNIYTTNNSDSELVFENRYMMNPTMPQVVSGVREDKIVAPCIFLKMKQFSNEPFSFGGNDLTTVNMRAVIISDDEFKLSSVGNIFTDTKNTNFAVLTGSPINKYGDIKNGHYSYTGVVASQQPNELAFISNCSYTRFSQSAIAEKQPDMCLGFLDFNIQISRWPRA